MFQSVCILGGDYNENSFLTVLFLWFCINQIEPNLLASGALRKPLTPAHILINVGTLQIWRWRQDALNMCVIKAVKQMAHCDFLFAGNGESRQTQPLKKYFWKMTFLCCTLLCADLNFPAWKWICGRYLPDNTVTHSSFDDKSKISNGRKLFSPLKYYFLKQEVLRHCNKYNFFPCQTSSNKKQSPFPDTGVLGRIWDR